MKSLLKNKVFYNACIVPLVILVSGFFRAVCVQTFITPFNFAPGGSTGLATIINYATRNSFDAPNGFPISWLYLMINVPLIVISFIFIGKSFTFKTGGAIVASSVIMYIMEKTNFPQYENVAGNSSVLAAIASGALGGIGLAMMLKIGGSTGGSDIVAVIIQRKLSATNVSWFIYAIDATIVFISAFVFQNGLNPILLSLVEMCCLSIISDVITSGFKSALKYEIITKDPEPLAQDLLKNLGRGVTCQKVIGMYSHDDKYMLMCIIRKHQLSDFNAILAKYPDTFAYLSNTREVVGLGFSKYDELQKAASDANAQKTGAVLPNLKKDDDGAADNHDASGENSD